MPDITLTEDQKASIRAHELLIGFGTFLESAGLDSSLFECDKILLLATAKRYCSDVARLHHHHTIDLIDCYKIAGYTSYWICKMKPFRVKNLNTAYIGKAKGLFQKVCKLHLGC